MQFQFSGYKVFLAAALLLGNAVPALGESAVDASAQAQPAKYDFNVMTAVKDETHPHHGEGVETGYVINGVQSPALVLVRGKTYTFNVDTGVTHDFYFSTKPKGWGMDTLAAGVKGQFTYKGVVTFTPTAETPNVVYTACRNHKFMGGEIRIINPGEEDKFPNAAQTAGAAPMTEAKPLAGAKPSADSGY